MSLALDISHIGESLVAELLNNQAIKEKIKDLAKLSSLPKEAKPNVPISNDSDPMHRIDVLITGEDNSLTAIEVKFGTTIITPGAYCARYLSNTTDGSTKGNMINKLIEGVTIENQKIEKKWVLLVRNKKIRKKLSSSAKLGATSKELWEKMCKNCCIVSLEDLLLGVEEDVFETAVKKCLTPLKSFHEDWEVSLSVPSGL